MSRLILNYMVYVLCLGQLTLHAADGTVQTSDGHLLKGQIQLDAGYVLVGNDTNGEVKRVPLNEVTMLRCQAPPQEAEAPELVHGLRATYFSRQDFTGKVVFRTDRKIDSDWSQASPFEFTGTDHFSVRWEGLIQPTNSGLFIFTTESEAMVRLWIRGQLIINRWGDRSDNQETSAEPQAGKIQLQAGQKYSFRMEYCDKGWNPNARLYWSCDRMARQVVPTECLYSTPVKLNNVADAFFASCGTNGLLGMYFSEPDLGGEFQVRSDPNIDFDWGEDSPFNGITSENFSVRWMGRFTAPTSEPYAFHTLTDGGVRLWVDDKLVIDGWRRDSLSQASTKVALTAGKSYLLKLEVFSGTGRAMARLSWSTPSITQTVIPSAALLPPSKTDLEAMTGKAQITPPGLLLTSGSMIAAPMKSADGTSVQFSQGGQLCRVSLVKVASIILQPLSSEVRARIKPGQAGVLLANKDFVAGEFKGYRDGRVQMGSILFGNTNYDPAEVLAIALRDATPEPSRFVLRKHDNTVLLVNTIRLEQGFLVVQDTALAGIRIPLGDVAELKRVS